MDILSINKERLKQTVIKSLQQTSSLPIMEIELPPINNKDNELEVISREYEESFLRKGKCESSTDCVGYLLPLLDEENRKGFALAPFVSPKGKAYPCCLLCLRRKVTIEWIQLIKHNVTAAHSILPYQNIKEEYNDGDLIPIIADDVFRGVLHPFVFFSLSKYMYDEDGKITQRQSFYQSKPLSFLPEYLTIDILNKKVGVLIDVTNVIPYVLFWNSPSPITIDTEQRALIELLKNGTRQKKEKEKYRYLLNSAKYAFGTASEQDAIYEMLFYMCKTYLPFIFTGFSRNEIGHFKSFPYTLPINMIKAPSLPISNNVLACLDCKEISCVYVYDVVTDTFECKVNKAHHLLEIEGDGKLIEFFGFNYLPCSKCNAFKRIASGVTLPKKEPGMTNTEYKKHLRKIPIMNAYTKRCMDCENSSKIIMSCGACGMVHKNTIKKPWQKIRVFDKKKQFIIYLCHEEPKLKNNTDRIWSLPLLLNSLKR